MKTILPIFLLLSLTLTFINRVFCQEGNQINITYQEGETKITSQAVDDSGNIYHAGVFRAALLVSGDTLATGLGGIDNFIIKRSKNGEVLWVIPFGSAFDDGGNLSVSIVGNNILLHGTLPYEINFNGTILTPIFENSQNFYTICINDSGTIKWFNRTNIPITRFQPNSSGKIWAIMQGIEIKNAAKSEAKTLYNFNGENAALILSISDNGEFSTLGKIASKFNQNVNTSILIRNNFKSNSLFFLVTVNNFGSKTGEYNLEFNNNLLPTSDGICKYLIKTDTLFNLNSYKRLNINGKVFFSNTDPENEITFSSDSSYIHLLLNNNRNGAFSIDTFSLDLKEKSGLAIFDTNLNFIGTKLFYENQKNFFINRIQEYKNEFYIFGQLKGKITHLLPENLPVDNYQFRITPKNTIDFNLNGVSKEFFLKVDTSLEYIDHIWIGDYSVQESFQLEIRGITFKDSSCHFFQLFDNKFNPWKIGLDLKIKNGESIVLSDGPDYINYVGYFNNSLRLGIGESKGFNIFDKDKPGIIKSFVRKDFFYVLMDTTDKMVKYFRLRTSFTLSSVMRLRKVNNSFYCLIDLFAGSNTIGLNYFEINNQIVNVTEHNCRVLLIIDSIGNSSFHRVDNLSFGNVADFDVYNNGDIILITSLTTRAFSNNGINYQSSPGNFIVKVNKLFNVLNALKVLRANTSFPMFNKIQIIPESEEFVFWGNGTFPRNSGNSMVVNIDRGSGNLTSLVCSNATITQDESLQFGFFGKVSFISNGFFSALGPFDSPRIFGMATNNKSILVSFNLLKQNNLPVYLNNVLVENVPYKSNNIVLEINLNGNINRKSQINSINTDLLGGLNINSFKKIEDYYYLIGNYTKDIKFGAIESPHRGEGDGIVIKLDSLLNIVQIFTAGSPFNDYCTDIDISKDSSIFLAYHSKGQPQVKMRLFSTTPTDILSKSMEASGWISFIPSSAIPRDFIYTIKQGDWHDATIWNNGKVPINLDRVIIRHKVQINQPADCFQLLLDPNADLKANDGARLNIWGMLGQGL